MGEPKNKVSSDVVVDYKGEQITIHFGAHRVESFSASEYFKNGMMRTLRDAVSDSHPHSWASINDWIMSLEGQQKIFYCMITGEDNGKG